MIGQILQQWRHIPLGWLQLSKEKSRLLVALSGIAFADILMFMQLGFQTALYDSNTKLHKSMKADIVLISPLARNLANMSTFSRRRLYQAQDVPGVKSAETLYTNFVDWTNPQTRGKTAVLVIGFNLDTPAFDLPEVNSQLDIIKLPDTVLFDRAARGDYSQVIAQINSGKSVTTEIDRRTINIEGLFKVGASFLADGTVITSDQNFLQLFPKRDAGSINVGLLKVKPGYDPQQVANTLKHVLDKDVKVLTKAEFIQYENDYWQKNTAIGFIFSLGVTMGFIVGLIIVYQVLANDVNAHIKEYATFKAIGYRNIYLLSVVFEEAIIMSVLGFIPGIAISYGLYALTLNVTNLPLYMTLGRAIQVQILTIIMCMLSGAIATRKVQSADPADMF